MADKRFVTLVGLKHVGKSTIGRLVAEKLQPARFVDLDDTMLTAARNEGWFQPENHETPPVRALYRFLGKKSFESWEAEVLQRVLASQSDEADSRCVLATGGGICDNPDAVALLAQARPVLYIWESPPVLCQRVLKHGIPPFLDQHDPKGSFLRMAERRDRLYRELADNIISIAGATAEEAADRILVELR